MAAALITASTASSGIGSIMTVLADQFLQSKRNKGRILRACNTDAQQTPGPHGTARVMIAASDVTVNDETDGTTPALDDTNGTYVDVPLTSHKTCVFGFTEIAQTLDGGRSIAPVVQSRMYSLFNAIEVDVAAIAATFSTNVFGSQGVPLTQVVVEQARAALVGYKVPDVNTLNAFYLYGTNSWDAISNFPNFNLFFNTGRTSPQIDADFGSEGVMWKNARHWETQSVRNNGGIIYNFMMHRDAILVAMQAIQVPTSPGVEAMNFQDPDSGIAWQIVKYYDQAHGGDVMKIHSLYGRILGRETFGALMEA